VMSNIVIFTIVIWLSARSLNRTDVERRQTEEVIRQTAAELQHTHAQLRLSEERLRLAVTGAGLGTWHWDLSTDTLVWSDSCLALFGLPPGTSMSYAMFLAALHSADRARVDETVRRVLADRSEYDIECRTVWPDGSTHWIAAKGRGYYDAAGQPLRMEGVAMDITARIQAALALHESEERFRLVVESA